MKFRHPAGVLLSESKLVSSSWRQSRNFCKPHSAVEHVVTGESTEYEWVKMGGLSLTLSTRLIMRCSGDHARVPRYIRT